MVGWFKRVRAALDELQARVTTLEGLRDRLLQLEADRAALARHTATLLEEQKWLREQLREKDKLIVGMRREGFDMVTPPPVDVPVASKSDLPPEVMDSLELVADPGSAEWRRELREAERALLDGKEPAEVAKAIRKGGTYSPWSG